MILEQSKVFNRYLRVFGASLAALSVVPLLGFVYVFRIHEHDSFVEIVNTQKQKGAIYGTALNPNDLKYKLELYRSRQTDYVVLGSSRSMKFRSEFFKQPITNLGGTFSTLNEGQEFIHWILQVKQPKAILLVVDYWWFHRSYSYDERRRFVSETSLNQDKLLKPWAWLFEKKIEFSEFIQTILRGASSNPYNSHLSLGLRAIKYSSGFRYDGSYMEVENDTSAPGRRIEAMKLEIQEIQAEKNLRAGYGYGDFIDEIRWKQFVSILAEIRKGSELIVVLPPVAPMLSIEMDRNPNRKFVQQLQRKLKDLNVPSVDFSDFRKLTTSDAEFLDIWHPGEIAVLRQLVEIKRLLPQTVFAQNIDENLCQRTITKDAGKGMISEALESRGVVE